MPDQKGNPLPPLTKNDLDGESEKVDLAFPRHSHKPVYIGDNTIKCPCGAGWSGPNIEALLKAFSV